MRSCTHKITATARYIEVQRAVASMGSYPGMLELYRAGAFRHEYDVAYARILLERFGHTIDYVKAEIDKGYTEEDVDCPGIRPLFD